VGKLLRGFLFSSVLVTCEFADLNSTDLRCHLRCRDHFAHTRSPSEQPVVSAHRNVHGCRCNTCLRRFEQGCQLLRLVL
jgi:hypothetical protein